MFRGLAYALLFSLLSLTAFAQKLASVQEASVWAPANIKVDAKLNEWDNTFQAFNKTTNIYYTVANDGANFYLVIKSANQTNNNKIIGGGVTLTINTDGRKKDNAKDAFVIEFPVINYENLRSQMMSFRGNATTGPPDSAAIQNMRKKAVSAFKEVKLFGFKDISDSVISVYNEYGIKAFVDFDDKGSLAIEMAIPLKYLQITPDVPIAYNIRLNGININKIMPGMMAAGGPGGGFAGGGGGGFGGGGGGFGGGGGATTVVVGRGGGGPPGMPRGMDDMMSMLSPTDFWGKYTLAKKK